MARHVAERVIPAISLGQCTGLSGVLLLNGTSTGCSSYKGLFPVRNYSRHRTWPSSARLLPPYPFGNVDIAQPRGGSSGPEAKRRLFEKRRRLFSFWRPRAARQGRAAEGDWEGGGRGSLP